MSPSIAYYHNGKKVSDTFWNDVNAIKEYLQRDTNKEYYIKTFLEYLESLNLKLLAYIAGIETGK